MTNRTHHLVTHGIWTIFALFVWVSLCLPNIVLSITEPIESLGIAANILLPCGLYLLFLTISPRIGAATLWCFPLMFFAAFQMVLIKIFGRSPIATDMFLNLVTTNSSEAGELLNGIEGAVVIVAIIYLTDICGGILAIYRHARLPERLLFFGRTAALAFIIVGSGCLVGAICAEPSYRVSEYLYPVNVVRNMGHAFEITNNLRHYDRTSADFHFHATTESSDSVAPEGELYILFVGETSRADNWQILGYERPTTPRLANRPHLISYSNAFSESNTTHKSVPLLLSHLNAENYDSLKYVKGVVTAFKEAGFHTAVISSQKPNHSYIQYFCSEADTTIYLPEHPDGSPVSDTELFPYVRSRINARAPRQMILIHSYGSHFNYLDRYPESLAFFKPDRPYKAQLTDRDIIINAYDNSIRITDLVLDSIATMAQESGARAAMIYASDHGEDIFDGGRDLFLHASPVPTAMQVHIPLLLWFSDAYLKFRPEAEQIAKSRMDFLQSSSTSYFHTALDMAGIRTPYLNLSLSLISPTWEEYPIKYLTDASETVSLTSFLLRYDEELPGALLRTPLAQNEK